jgi:hypothetical protein
MDQKISGHLRFMIEDFSPVWQQGKFFQDPGRYVISVRMTCFDLFEYFRIKNSRPTQSFSHNLACQVIACGAQTTCDDNKIRATDGTQESFADF